MHRATEVGLVVAFFAIIPVQNTGISVVVLVTHHLPRKDGRHWPGLIRIPQLLELQGYDSRPFRRLTLPRTAFQL